MVYVSRFKVATCIVYTQSIFHKEFLLISVQLLQVPTENDVTMNLQCLKFLITASNQCYGTSVWLLRALHVN